jgi:hypothetical protein
LTGYDEAGKQVWEEWPTLVEADPWQNGCIWFDIDSTEVVDIFPGFMRRWKMTTGEASARVNSLVFRKQQKSGWHKWFNCFRANSSGKAGMGVFGRRKRSISAHGFEKIPLPIKLDCCSRNWGLTRQYTTVGLIWFSSQRNTTELMGRRQLPNCETP